MNNTISVIKGVHPGIILERELKKPDQVQRAGIVIQQCGSLGQGKQNSSLLFHVPMVTLDARLDQPRAPQIRVRLGEALAFTDPFCLPALNR